MHDYWNAVRDVAVAYIDEIEADLRLARRQLENARGEARDAEARVQTLQALFDLTIGAQEAPTNTERLTLHLAMVEVLRSAPERMMRAGDLAAEIHRRRLYQMRDGRAAEPQQIHARAGNYTDLFEKVGTFIKLRE